MFKLSLKGDSPTAAALEIAFVVACVLAAEWVSPLLFAKNWFAGAVPAVIGLAFVIISQRSKKESFHRQGWRLDNLGRASVLLAPLMIAASLALLASGSFYGRLRLTSPPLEWRSLELAAALYLWGLLQQYPLQAFINRRAQAIWGPGPVSILFTAGVFSLLHFPNLPLAAATFFGGLMWAFVYQRQPNLWALALSHALMTFILLQTIGYEALHGLRVGYNYFR